MPSMPIPVLRASDLRSDANQPWLLCPCSQLGLQRGSFPPRIETNMGDGSPFQLDHPIFDESGKFLGVIYRQSGGSEVLVFLD